MQFKEWLTLAEATVADELRKIDKNTLAPYKSVIRDYVSKNVEPAYVDVLTNFFTNLYFNEKVPLAAVLPTLISDWEKYSAYITATIGGQQRQQYLTIDLNREGLDVKNHEYHRAMKLGKRGKGPKGLDVVNISSVLENPIFRKFGAGFSPASWAGWKWTSLGCGYSGEEAQATATCGNEGAVKGDNIFTLRDPKGNSHLIFIVNTYTGSLGESKAPNNEKPPKEYHAAVVALLLSGYVKRVEGGGYRPENNFAIEDLKPELQKIVSAKLQGVDKHEIPTNYYPIEYISQKTQQDVDKMAGQEKVEFLKSILRTIENHKPLRHDKEEKNAVPEIKFDINKLALDSTPLSKNISEKLDMLDKLTNLFYNNKLYSDEAVQTYHPGLYDDYMNLDIKGKREFYKNNVKSPSLNVRSETLSKITDDLTAQIKKGNVHSQIKFHELLSEIGYREDPDDWKKDHNVYQSSLDEIEKDIIEKIVKKGKIPHTAMDIVSSFIGKATKDMALVNPIFTQDMKKVYLGFDFSPSIKNIPEIVVKLYPSLLPLLVKYGFSRYEGGQKAFKFCFVDILRDNIVDKTKEILKRRYKSKVGFKSRYGWGAKNYLNYFLDSVEALKEVYHTGKIAEIEEFKNFLTSLQNNLIERIDVEKLAKNNAKEIVACSKEKKEEIDKAHRWSQR